MRTLGVLAPTLLLLGACTTLGPMAASTGTVPIPAPRTGAEVQVGVVPGYFLSQGVKSEAAGAPIGQAAVLLDLGRLVGLPGLVIGGRYLGGSNDGGYPEPMLGYRTLLGKSQQLGAAFVAHGGHGSGEQDGASYEATTLGVEAAFDLRVTARRRWFELHLTGSATASALDASGRYCVGMDGFGVMCPEPGDPPGTMVDASAGGIYPAVAVGLAVDTARHLAGYFHGARLSAQIAAGAMPRFASGEQQSAAGYLAIGLSLTIGFGAKSGAKSGE